MKHLSGWLGVDVRTLRRWCDKGAVPGAYRRRKGRGHWRIRDLHKATALLTEHPPQWCRQRKPTKKNPLQQTTLNIRQMREELSNPNSPGKLAMRIYLAKKHAVTLEELTAARFHAHTSELTHDLWRRSIADFNREIPTEVWRIAQSPRLAHLFLAVCEIRYKQLPSTAKYLAQILGISRASLYRRYNSEQIQASLAAIGQTQMPVANTILHGQSAQDCVPKIRKYFHSLNGS